MDDPATLTFESYRAMLRALYMDTGDGVLFMGSDGVILDVNDRMGDIFAMDRLDMLGMACRRLLAASDRRHVDGALAELAADECLSVEAEGVAGAGRGFVLMPSAAPYGRTVSSTTMQNYEAMLRLAEAW